MIEKNKAYKYFCYMWEDYDKDYEDETKDYKGVANMIIWITGYDNKLFIVTWEDKSYSKYRYELPFQLYLFDFYEETIEYCGYLDPFEKDPKHKICIGKTNGKDNFMKLCTQSFTYETDIYGKTLSQLREEWFLSLKQRYE